MSTLTVIKRTLGKEDETIAEIEYQDSNRPEKLNQAIDLAKSNTDRQYITCVVLDSELEPLKMVWDTGACFAVEY